MAKSNQLKVKRLHPDAIIPQYQSAGAACFDLHAVGIDNTSVEDTKVLRSHGLDKGSATVVNGAQVFSTGLAFEVPPGWVMLVFSRSGHGFKHGVRLANCVGVIDSDYRGAVDVKLTADSLKALHVVNGDRIAQAMLLPAQQWQLIEVEELSDTARGTSGLGSTGQ